MTGHVTAVGSPAGDGGAAAVSSRAVIRAAIGAAIIVALLAAAAWLAGSPGHGAESAFSLLVGAALGIVFARGRFCFFCIMRDFIEDRDSAPLYAVLAALAVGGVGYTIVFGMFLPDPSSGRLPAEAHIGPVSWVLVAGGLAFGVGMALSGACISGHLYRLGEGYGRAPLALLGALVGFGLGFLSWPTLYLGAIVSAPTLWPAAELGYAGALLVHLVVLGALALLLLRWLPPVTAREGGRLSLRTILTAVFVTRWNPLVTGALVGLIGVFAYLRVEPLGVTSQLGSVTRTLMSDANLLGDRLNGLDVLRGCATVVSQVITDNGWLIGALVLGSLAVSVAGGRFRPSGVTLRNGSTAFLGGILMGWGAMVSLGCTVGTLLSGISASAISGWVFGLAVFGGVWLGIRLGLHRS
ncbi:YeeE/YedE family protein [soil metagenome]